MTDYDKIRPGETAIDLPASFDAGLYYIGRIHTPWQRRAECPKNANAARAARIPCTIKVDPRYAAGLQEVATCSHLLVLYWMHQARRDLITQSPRHYDRARGTFALRSPVRPNPIAASVVELVQLDGTKLEVIGLDCLDGTPLLDLKPYFASTDAIPEAVVGWHAQQRVDDE